MWYIHTRECYSAIKRNEALIYAVTWMNPEDMLSERSQTERSHIVRFHFNEMSRTGKSKETESR